MPPLKASYVLHVSILSVHSSGNVDLRTRIRLLTLMWIGLRIRNTDWYGTRFVTCMKNWLFSAPLLWRRRITVVCYPCLTGWCAGTIPKWSKSSPVRIYFWWPASSSGKLDFRQALPCPILKTQFSRKQAQNALFLWLKTRLLGLFSRKLGL